jgi:IMP dehydrogenase
MTVREVLALTRSYRISGLPVVDNGVVVGIVTNRDTAFRDQPGSTGAQHHDAARRLITVSEGSSPEEAKALMHKHRLERVLVVNAGFELRGLMTVKDILKSTDTRMPARTSRGTCASAPRSAWARAPRSASNCWPRPAST